MISTSSLIIFFFGCFLLAAEAFVNVPLLSQSAGKWMRPSSTVVKATRNEETPTSTIRRSFFGNMAVVGLVVTSTVSSIPIQPAWARYILDEETGDYVEMEDVAWQTEWKQRLDKASTMSKDEIFEAARGAGNTDLKTGPESAASKKRRAMSACRDSAVRAKTGLADEKECTARVFAGEIDFLLEAL